MAAETIHDQVARMITGNWLSQAIYVACKFEIADRLSAGPVSVAQLAEGAQVHEDSLFRLLRALASVGIFAECGNREFQLTSSAETLRGDSPDSLRPMALMMGNEMYRTWGHLANSIVTGKPAFDDVYGEPFFAYLANHPESAKVFDAAMTAIHGRETGAILDAYDFAGIKVLADIGGGNGSKLSAILQRHPQLAGILFDLPHVVERAKTALVSTGVADRCQAVGGDFFEAVPAGADAYLMRHIIHDWNDEQSLQILKNCHAVMPADGKLLVIESVIPTGNGPCPAKFLDLTMLLVPGGRERTEVEYRALYEKAGFELTRVVQARLNLAVIEGHPRS